MKPGTIFMIGDKAECRDLGLPEQFAHKLGKVVEVITCNSYVFNLIESCRPKINTNHWSYFSLEPNIVLEPSAQQSADTNIHSQSTQ